MGLRTRLSRLFSNLRADEKSSQEPSETQYVTQANVLLDRLRSEMAKSKSQNEPEILLTLARAFAWLSWQSITSSKFDTQLDAHVIWAASTQCPPTYGEGSRNKIVYITSGLLSSGGLTQMLLNLLDGHGHDESEVSVFSTEQFGDTDTSHPRVKEIMAAAPVRFVSDREDISACIDEMTETISDIDPGIVVYLLSPDDVIAAGLPAIAPERRHVFINASQHVTTVGSFQFDVIVDIMPDFFEETKRTGRNTLVEYISLAGRMSRAQGEEIIPAGIRTSLDLEPDTNLSMTIGNPQKCLWAGDRSYPRAMAAALMANPLWHHVLVAKGMETVKSSILEIEPSLVERIHCLPPTQEILPVLKACDLYINSFPISGALSILDSMTVNRPSVFGPLDLNWFELDEFTAINETTLREKTSWLMSDDEARVKSSKESAKVYDDRLDPEVMRKRYALLFDALEKGGRTVNSKSSVEITGRRHSDSKRILKRVEGVLADLMD